jgi:hypothetical protein
MDTRSITAGILGTLIATTAAAVADQPIPSYARTEEVIHGTVASVNGTTLYVHDDRGFTDNVLLKNGTIINPTGLLLAHGQTVTIHGVTRGSVFEAAEIDTPYVKTYAYAIPAYGPAYPYHPYGYGYGYYPGYYGPALNVGIGFRFH